MSAIGEVRATPFHSRAAVLNRGNRWSSRNGWTLASDYGDPNFEVLAARMSVVLADISWRWRARLEGTRVTEFLSRLLTKDVSGLSPGSSLKALWLSDQGGVRGAGAVARFGREAFVLAASAPDHDWIASAASQFDVTARDISEEEGGIALIGPYAGAVLKAAGLDADLEALEFRKQFWHGLETTVSRWGEHGGYEIWCARDDALAVWDRVVKAGAEFAIVPAGLIAMDILDLERGVARPGRDYLAAQLGSDTAPTPLSLGLERLIDENHSRFNGRVAWLAARSNEKLRFAGIELDCEIPPAKFAAVTHDGKAAGHVMASAYSPALQRAIALAQIDAAVSAPGTVLKVALPPAARGDEEAIAQVVELPFLSPPDAL